MPRLDTSKYKDLDSIERDIKSVTIQGATNVAIATMKGIKLFSKDYRGDDYSTFLKDLQASGMGLAETRENEPLAKNGVRFVLKMLALKHPDITDVEMATVKVMELANEYLAMIKESKKRIIEHSKTVTEGMDEVLTHCHSSTAENVIIDMSKRTENFVAVCTETRPLYQGHKTAKNLVAAGVDTTLIVDSSAESFIIGRGEFNIDVIFIGADEITVHGDAINKVGSWGIALAAQYANKPLYVITPLLKVEPETAFKPALIEKRDPKEIWDNAPEGLKMYNPSFDLIDAKFITGYITEVGVLKPKEVVKALRNNYEWAF